MRDGAQSGDPRAVWLATTVVLGGYVWHHGRRYSSGSIVQGCSLVIGANRVALASALGIRTSARVRAIASTKVLGLTFVGRAHAPTLHLASYSHQRFLC